MSVLDTNDLEPRLSPRVLKKLYEIPELSNVFRSGKYQIYSKGYITTKIANKSTLIEVWCPGSTYAGTLWRYNGITLHKNLVYIQYLDTDRDGWWTNRLEYAYYDLTLDEFDFMYKALENNDIELLDNLYIHKAFPYEQFNYQYQ